MSNFNKHYSVLLKESIEALNIKKDGIYFDCTFGRGGHSLEILKKLNQDGKLYAIDCDASAIEWSSKIINDNRFQIIHDNFSNLENILKELKIDKIDGFLFDLGVSSPQLDDPERGFSYHHDAVLDMRMDQSKELDAKKVLNSYTLEELVNVFKQYGESKYAYSVAKNVIKARITNPITTTLEFVNIIKSSLPIKELFNKKHPARVFFQAIRMEVNKEVDSIKKAIKVAINNLNSHGRLVIISFHSLENKIVKQEIIKNTKRNSAFDYLPTTQDTTTFRLIKPKQVSEHELNENNRSRSARLNIIERN